MRAVRVATAKVKSADDSGSTTRASSRLEAALATLADELTVARADLTRGKTQQARSRGYVNAGDGVDDVSAAEAEVIAACPK
jgi:hypothetical protein